MKKKLTLLSLFLISIKDAFSQNASGIDTGINNIVQNWVIPIGTSIFGLVLIYSLITQAIKYLKSDDPEKEAPIKGFVLKLIAALILFMVAKNPQWLTGLFK